MRRYNPILLIVLLVGVLSAVAFQKSGEPEPITSTWAIVHSTDSLAASRVANAKSLGDAHKAARELGYEAVLHEGLTYFFPIPVWSAGSGAEVKALLADAFTSGFERDIHPDDLSQGQQDHLDNFLHNYAGKKVGGTLGQNIRNSVLGSVRLERSFDFEIKTESGNTKISLPVSEAAKWFGGKQQHSKSEESRKLQYPRRKELLGLGTKGFSLALHHATDSNTFDKVLNSAKELLHRRREEARKDIQKLCFDSVNSTLGESGARKLLAGEKQSFDDLPQGMKDYVGELVAAEPGILGLSSGVFAKSSLVGATVCIPSGGLRVFLNFRLQGAGRASDGSVVTYSVAFEVKEVLDGG